MTIDEAIQHCKEQVQEQAKKGCYSCAEEHQQLAEWLKELKAYKEQRGERMNVEEKERLIKKDIASIENRVRHAFNQGYEMGLKESRSENPNTCGDAISRQAVLDEIDRRFDLAKPFKQLIESMPSVTPQQRTGRWKFTVYDANSIGHYECTECHWNVLMNVSDYCPHCGAKMEVEE